MGGQSAKTVSPDKLFKGKRDVSLIVPDDANHMHTVVVPRALLIERSPVFREMALSGNLKKHRRVKLPDVNVIGVLKILEFIENGNVFFHNVREAVEAYVTAEIYQIDGIKDICLEHLNTTLDSGNVCKIYEFSLMKDMNELTYKCLKTIDEFADKVLMSSGFKNLRQPLVIDIVKRNSLNISSEKIVLEGIINWGKAECKRKNIDLDDFFDQLMKVVKPAVVNVRFSNMTDEELSDSVVASFQHVLSPNYKRRESQLGLSINPSPSLQAANRSSVVENAQQVSQLRQYVKQYTHRLNIFDAAQPAISNGETFTLTVEVLKGRVYLCGVTLAIRTFSPTMSASCLYVILSVTNTNTTVQRKVRGTFLNINEECCLSFANPLFIKDNETAQIALSVKMAGNVCPLLRKNDVEIVIPDSKDIALKILPDSSNNLNIRCIFKDLIYYF